MKCPNCGHELADNVRFCVNCGSKIEAQKPQPQPAQQAQPAQTQQTAPRPAQPIQPAQQPMTAQAQEKPAWTAASEASVATGASAHVRSATIAVHHCQGAIRKVPPLPAAF